MEKNKGIEVVCPHCKKKFFYYTSEYRPFCSERCKMVDLGHWLNESYHVAGQEISKSSENEFEMDMKVELSDEEQ